MTVFLCYDFVEKEEIICILSRLTEYRIIVIKNKTNYNHAVCT